MDGKFLCLFWISGYASLQIRVKLTSFVYKFGTISLSLYNIKAYRVNEYISLYIFFELTTPVRVLCLRAFRDFIKWMSVNDNRIPM